MTREDYHRAAKNVCKVPVVHRKEAYSALGLYLASVSRDYNPRSLFYACVALGWHPVQQRAA